jgi:nucleotide-binding universal stress UspA family protein
MKPSRLGVCSRAQALVAATGGVLKLVRASGVEAEAGFGSLVFTAERLREAGLAVESTVVADQDAKTAILETAARWQPDLIDGDEQAVCAGPLVERQRD